MAAAESCDSTAELLIPSIAVGGEAGAHRHELDQASPNREEWSGLEVSPGVVSAGWLTLEIDAEEIAFLKIDPGGWLESNGELIKESRIGRVFRIADTNAEIGKYYVKERCYRTGYEVLVQRLRVSGLRRACRLSHHLLRNGISTPASRGFITVRGGKETREYLFKQSVPGGESLHNFLANEYAVLGADEQRQFRGLLSEELAEMIAGLHRAGCENRDLKATNLILANPVENLRERGIVDLFLIDLEGVRRLGFTPRFRRERDITRLHLSLMMRAEFHHADRARFLTRYQSYFGESGWKRAWRRLTRSTERRLVAASKSGKTIH